MCERRWMDAGEQGTFGDLFTHMQVQELHRGGVADHIYAGDTLKK